MNIDQIINQLTEICLNYGPRLIGAVLVWLIGGLVIKGVSERIGNFLMKTQMEDSLRPFLTGLLKIILKVMLVISVLTMLGIEMTSFIAILGAAGLAIGMALSGTLQNFAGGVMLLIFKPFKVGDVIDAQGYLGAVSEIQIFNTILKTPDNKTIIIPNGGLSSSAMTNYSTEDKRRVDWTFGIGYGDSTTKAENLINRLCNEDVRILKDPEVFIAVSELADNSINMVVRAWVKAEDYWGVFFDMNKKIYDSFGNEGLNIPFPQMDVHLHETKK